MLDHEFPREAVWELTFHLILRGRRSIGPGAPVGGERVRYEIRTGVTNSETTSNLTLRIQGISWVNARCTQTCAILNRQN